jgi:hypothetical protein
MINVFKQCFSLDNMQHEVIDDIQRSASKSFKFLTDNYQHFDQKCSEEFCQTLDAFLKKAGRTETASLVRDCIEVLSKRNGMNFVHFNNFFRHDRQSCRK